MELLEPQIESLEVDKSQISVIQGKLEYATDEIMQGADKILRYIMLTCLNPLESEIQSKIVRFHAQLDKDLEVGINEEDDIKMLQETLHDFVLGSWENFVKEDIEPFFVKEAERLDETIDSQIAENIERTLKSVLNEKEYEQLQNIVSGVVHTNIRVHLDEADIPIPANNDKDLKAMGIVPACLLAMGGFALLVNSLVPAAMFAVASYKAKVNFTSDAKEQLLSQSRELSLNYMQEMEKTLDWQLKNSLDSLQKSVDDSYKVIIKELTDCIEHRKKDSDGIEEYLTQLKDDILKI